MGPTGNTRIIQVHPTRFCNLQCLHCYSNSGPKEREELDSALLFNFLEDAVLEGYNVLAVSGGEPLLYSALQPLLQKARACNMHTSLTTNGILLDERRLGEIQNDVDLIAISLDGVPESHNRMRNSPHAFTRMKRNLANLRQSGVKFGFIFTLTQYNLNELPWVVAFALEHGASLLQIHPLEATGRALECLQGEQPDFMENLFAALQAGQIQTAVSDKLSVQLDLVNRESLSGQQDRVFAGPHAAADDQLLADLVSPLIVETDGTLAPLTYGFSRRYALGNLHQKPLPLLIQDWKQHTLAEFYELTQAVYEKALEQKKSIFFNWYEAMKTAAEARFADCGGSSLGLELDMIERS